MRDQFSGRGKLPVFDMTRYSDLTWTSVTELFAKRVAGATE